MMSIEINIHPTRIQRRITQVARTKHLMNRRVVRAKMEAFVSSYRMAE